MSVMKFQHCSEATGDEIKSELPLNKNSLIKHSNPYRHQRANCDKKSTLSYGPHEVFCKRPGFIQIRLLLYSTPLDVFKILAHSENAERNELQKI